MKKILLFSFFNICIFSFLLFKLFSIEPYVEENIYALTTKENYKFLDRTETLHIPSYQGLCEKELFNKSSKIKNDEILLNNYISIFKQEVSFYEIEKQQNSLISNIEDEDLKKSLKISFRGIDIPLYEFYNYSYHCSQNKNHMLMSFIVFDSIFVLFSIFLIFIRITENKNSLKN